MYTQINNNAIKDKNNGDKNMEIQSQENKKIKADELTNEEIGKKLEELGWEKGFQFTNEIYTKTWNLFKVSTDGDYLDAVDDDVIEDILYIEYTINLEEKYASYIVYSGGANPGNAVTIEDDFEAVLNASLDDELFKKVEEPQFEVIVDTGSKMRAFYMDLVQLKKDFSNGIWDYEKGQYFLKYINNTNASDGDAITYKPLDEEEAKKIIKLDDEEEQYSEMCQLDKA